MTGGSSVTTAPGATRTMTAKDHGLTAAIIGFFAMAWFGWGHDGATSVVSIVLDVGAALAAIAFVTGLVLFIRARGPLAAGNSEDSKRYGVIVGVEFALAFAGAAGFGALGQAQWIPVWILAVVAIHFFPLTRVLHNPSLARLGVATLAVVAAALIVGLASGVKPGVVTGLGGGVCLLTYAIRSLVLARR